MPRLKGSADLLEDRRKRALALLDSGYSLNEVGRRIGCNASSVMRWRDARRKRGAEGLRVRSSPGRSGSRIGGNDSAWSSFCCKAPGCMGTGRICGRPSALRN